MKKSLFLLLCSVLLTGCAAEDTFETVADDWAQSVAAPKAEIVLVLPEEAASPVVSGEDGTLYQCDGYEIFLQTLESGDLDATLRRITGFGREQLTVMETQFPGGKRYDLVWSCMGENGEQVGRACLLDDGNYHYVLSTLADASRAGEFDETWEALFGSYSLG